MSEVWNVFNSIFTAGGIVTLLFGGSLLGLIIWITRKPKVHIINEPKSYWFYTFEEGTKHSKVNVLIEMEIINRGKENTLIEATLETNSAINSTYRSNQIELCNSKTIKRLFLESPFIQLYPKDYSFNGTLKIKPSGNRRLLIFGKKYLKFELNVSENQGKIYEWGNKNND